MQLQLLAGWFGWRNVGGKSKVAFENKSWCAEKQRTIRGPKFYVFNFGAKFRRNSLLKNLRWGSPCLAQINKLHGNSLKWTELLILLQSPDQQSYKNESYFTILPIMVLLASCKPFFLQIVTIPSHLKTLKASVCWFNHCSIARTLIWLGCKRNLQISFCALFMQLNAVV